MLEAQLTPPMMPMVFISPGAGGIKVAVGIAVAGTTGCSAGCRAVHPQAARSRKSAEKTMIRRIFFFIVS
jgi:AhpD family alkylhydroperoxidase